MYMIFYHKILERNRVNKCLFRSFKSIYKIIQAFTNLIKRNKSCRFWVNLA